MSSQQVEDEFAIRNLAAAYSDAANRGDLDGMLSVYCPDAVLVAFGGPETVGHAAIREVIGKTIADFEWIFQMTHSGLLRVEGDVATCRWWVSENALRKDGRGTQFMGVYQDKAVRTRAGWRFARRQLDAIFLRRITLEGRSFERASFEPGLWPPA
jgi:uncharacterized protein (TIGR02246 family)